MTQRLYSIEFLRIILTFLVTFGHCLQRYPSINEKIQNFSGVPFYGTGFAVEFFFIIAGFFLYNNLQRNISIFEFVKKLYLRVAPPLFVVFFLCVIFSITGIYRFPSVIALLPGLHLPTDVTGWGDWYVGVYFWIICFYFLLFRALQSYAILFTLAILYFTIHLKFHAPYPGFNTGYYTVIGTEIIRGVYCIAIGIFTGFIAKSINIDKNKCTVIFFTLVEIILLYSILHHLTFIKHFNFLEAIIVFSILIFSFAQSLGVVSKTLNNCAVVQIVSKYCYQIFIMHIFVLRLLMNNNYGLSDMECVLYIFLGAIALGVAEYHLIEKRFLPFCKKIFIKESMA